MRIPRHFCSVLIFVFCLAFTSVLLAQSAQHAALVEGAKKEGKLVWYTSMAIDTSKPLLDAFLQEYPFIKPDLVRAGEEQLMNRVLTETRAGKWYFDAISTSSISELSERKMIAPYFAPERDAFMDQFKDPTGIGSVFSSTISSSLTTLKWWLPKMRRKTTPTCSSQSGKDRS